MFFFLFHFVYLLLIPFFRYLPTTATTHHDDTMTTMTMRGREDPTSKKSPRDIVSWAPVCLFSFPFVCLLTPFFRVFTYYSDYPPRRPCRTHHEDTTTMTTMCGREGSTRTTTTRVQRVKKGYSIFFFHFHFVYLLLTSFFIYLLNSVFFFSIDGSRKK
jgi:hypothetical protein